MLSVMMQKSLLLYTGVARNSACCATSRTNRSFSTTQPRAKTINRANIRGLDYIRDPGYSKGLGFTFQERQALGIHGLLPCSHKSLQEQLEICRVSMARYKKPLNKYLFLSELQDNNEKLFYNFLATDIEGFMPLVYTPTVGLACQRFGLVFRRPRGLFISIHDKGHIRTILDNWPEHDVRAICFTDGERILGLGDLGAFGMGIPIGKLTLYTALASIPPHMCLPVTLDVGTNNTDLVKDPLYVGLRQPRVGGQEYFDFVAEFMEACMSRFGHNVLLQFEDFALPHATPLLNIWQNKCCTFNDDIQGTASVAVAGLFAAARITKRKMSENIYFFLGAGSAACGIANLCIMAMEEEGLSRKDAVDRIFLMDVDGLLTTQRTAPFPASAKGLERDLPHETDFAKCVATHKPTCLIGCSTVGGAFKPEILQMMKTHAERPIIFALSNPTAKAECTAQQAYDNTDGKCVFASGSPFPPVQHDGKQYTTGQGNNSYIFPGVALGVLAVKSIYVPDSLFLEAAKSLAKLVQQSDLDIGRIYPPLKEITTVSLDIAVDVAIKCYDLETQVEVTHEIKEICLLDDFNKTDDLSLAPCADRSQLVPNYEDELFSTETTQPEAVVPVAEKLDMEVVLKEVEKSKLYFDSWMFLVQIVTYYYILNPSL